MIADVPQIVTALVVSTVISVGTQLVRLDVQERLLEDNISATKELTQQMTGLTTQLAVFQEKYATKKELEASMKESK